MTMDIRYSRDHKTRLLVFILVFTTAAVTKTKQQDSFYFDPSPINQDVVDGAEALLRCDVSNRRQIMFYWTLNGRPLANTSRRFQEDSNLRILRVDRVHDAGSFRCIATNVTTGIALRSTEAKLNISWINSTVIVELKQQSTDDELVEGSELNLRCQTEGNPEPSVEWYRNKIRLFGSQRVRFTNKNQNRLLKITGVTSADNGVYSCRAMNPAGDVSSVENFLLNVPGVDIPRLNSATFTQQVLTNINGEARFNCQYSNAAIVEWYFDQNRLTNSDNKYTILANGTLIVRRVERQDAGVYRCVGRGDKGAAQTFSSELLIASLDELRDSSFEPKPTVPHVVPVAGKLEIRCLPPKGIPLPVMRWDGPHGVELTAQGRLRTADGVLSISNAEELDSGNYTCLASNLAGVTSRTVWIVVSVAPKLSRPPLSVRVTEGETATFDCRVTGTPYPVTVVTWNKDEEPVDANNARFVVNQSSGMLKIKDVMMSDEGNYACIINTTGHPVVISPNAHLYVEKQLKFRPLPVNTKLELGSNATVRCRAEGRAQPRIRWSKLDEPELPPHVHDVDGNLNFATVQSSDAGQYSCVATSEQGVINTTVRIDVVVRPRFKVKPLNTTAYEGYSTMLHCLAIGDPPPTINWDKNNRVTNFDSRRFKLLSNGSLYIGEVYMEDAGRYGCTAGNSGGLEREEIYLHVASADSYAKLHGSGGDGGPASDNSDMIKTIVIAVCCAVAYLAIVIGLTVYCSIRLMRAKNNRKQNRANNGLTASEKGDNGGVALETTELVDKSNKELQLTKLSTDQDAFSMSGAGSSHNSHSTNSRVSHRTYDKLAFPRSELQTLGMLGKGYYGDIFLAKAFGIRPTEPESLVLVKSLLSHHDVYQAEFYREVDLLSRANHDHIVRMLGICREMEPMFLITEYCEWGDLKQFLLAMRKDGTKMTTVRLPPLSVAQKLSICHQVALGLQHLAELRLVHRDVAARNVLLSPSLEVKLATPSLCRDVYAAEYVPLRQRLVPVRWSAPELLASFTADDIVLDGTAAVSAADIDDQLCFSTSTDVFAFGVFVWEVFTLGELPLRQLTDDDILRERRSSLISGIHQTVVRVQHPPGCPTDAWSVADRCLSDCPPDRPSFAELSTAFGQMLASVVI